MMAGAVQSAMAGPYCSRLHGHSKKAETSSGWEKDYNLQGLSPSDPPLPAMSLTPQDPESPESTSPMHTSLGWTL